MIGRLSQTGRKDVIDKYNKTMTRTDTQEIDPDEAEGPRVPGASSGHAPHPVREVVIADDIPRVDGGDDRGIQEDSGILPAPSTGAAPSVPH